MQQQSEEIPRRRVVPEYIQARSVLRRWEMDFILDPDGCMVFCARRWWLGGSGVTQWTFSAAVGGIRARGHFPRGAVAVAEFGDEDIGFGVFEERRLDPERGLGALIAEVNESVPRIIP